jgi:hypothetical protein
MDALVGFLGFLWVALAALVIAWLLLPLALFGVKPLLRELLAEQKRTNELLTQASTNATAAAQRRASAEFEDTRPRAGAGNPNA